VALLYAVVLANGTPEPEARAMVFATIVLGNVGLILSNRSRNVTLAETLRRPNPALWWVIGGALLGLGLALHVQPMREIFRFAPLSVYQLLASVAAATVGLAWLEVYKAYYRYAKRRGKSLMRGVTR
jgi:Ca2+-transporting ATPase